jgi:hypothetical protein
LLAAGPFPTPLPGKKTAIFRRHAIHPDIVNKARGQVFNNIPIQKTAKDKKFIFASFPKGT